MFGQEDLDRMQKEYEESGDKERTVFEGMLTHIHEKNATETMNQKKKLDSDPSLLYIHEKIYSIEGGSCWDGADEDTNYEVNRSEDQIAYSITGTVKSFIDKHFQLLDTDKNKVEEWMLKKVKSITKYSYITDYYVAEYYGNSDNYGIYKIDIQNLIETVCTDKEQKIFKEIKSKFVPPVKVKNRYNY